MDTWIIPAVLLALAIPVGVGLSRLGELFVLDVNGTSATLVRGRLPPRLWADLLDVLRRQPVASARLRVTIENGRPMLRVARGDVPETTLQRLRNVLGTWKTTQIRVGEKRA
jgi:hypothetical protein